MAISMIDRVPDMSDADLATLRDNAARLAEGGSEKQQAQARELMPTLLAEIERRGLDKAARGSSSKSGAAKRPAAKRRIAK